MFALKKLKWLSLAVANSSCYCSAVLRPTQHMHHAVLRAHILPFQLQSSSLRNQQAAACWFIIRCLLFAALYVLNRQDISLAAFDAAVADDACTDFYRLKYFSNLEQKGAVSSDDGEDEGDADTAAAVLRAGKLQPGAKLAAGTSSSKPKPRWCSTAAGSPHKYRFKALALLRQALALLRQQPGPAGLLGNKAAINALQELLPFAALLDLAEDTSGGKRSISGSSSSDDDEWSSDSDDDADEERIEQQLLALLPPAQRAWLLADAAEAVLLQDGNDSTR
jgi:hypothetical protein